LAKILAVQKKIFTDAKKVVLELLLWCISSLKISQPRRPPVLPIVVAMHIALVCAAGVRRL
jgi:hypothetical protein